MRLNIEKGTLVISEQTLRELMKVVEKVKEETEFTDDPMSDDDMTSETRIRMLRERGIITVASDYSKFNFRILLEKKPHSQELVGFRLVRE